MSEDLTDVRYSTLIGDVTGEQGRPLFLYIMRDGQMFSRQDLVEMALSGIEEVPRLCVTYRYRLDDSDGSKYVGRFAEFTPRTSQDARKAAKGKILKNVNIHAGIKALQNSDLCLLFPKFLIPTPEEMAQLEEQSARQLAEIQVLKEQGQSLQDKNQSQREWSGLLEYELTEAKKEIRALQEQIARLQDTPWNRIRRVFSKSKAAPE